MATFKRLPQNRRIFKKVFLLRWMTFIKKTNKVLVFVSVKN